MGAEGFRVGADAFRASIFARVDEPSETERRLVRLPWRARFFFRLSPYSHNVFFYSLSFDASAQSDLTRFSLAGFPEYSSRSSYSGSPSAFKS